MLERVKGNVVSFLCVSILIQIGIINKKEEDEGISWISNDWNNFITFELGVIEDQNILDSELSCAEGRLIVGEKCSRCSNVNISMSMSSWWQCQSSGVMCWWWGWVNEWFQALFTTQTLMGSTFMSLSWRNWTIPGSFKCNYES